MTTKEKGAPAVTTQGSPDRIKLNGDILIEPSAKIQEKNRLSASGFDTLCATSREEIGMLLSELAARAETGLLYVGLADERGLRYATNSIVNLAVRIGDEDLQLRRLRSEARAAEAERMSAIRQGEAPK